MKATNQLPANVPFSGVVTSTTEVVLATQSGWSFLPGTMTIWVSVTGNAFTGAKLQFLRPGGDSAATSSDWVTWWQDTDFATANANIPKVILDSNSNGIGTVSVGGGFACVKVVMPPSDGVRLKGTAAGAGTATGSFGFARE